MMIFEQQSTISDREEVYFGLVVAFAGVSRRYPNSLFFNELSERLVADLHSHRETEGPAFKKLWKKRNIHSLATMQSILAFYILPAMVDGLDNRIANLKSLQQGHMFQTLELFQDRTRLALAYLKAKLLQLFLRSDCGKLRANMLIDFAKSWMSDYKAASHLLSSDLAKLTRMLDRARPGLVQLVSGEKDFMSLTGVDPSRVAEKYPNHFEVSKDRRILCKKKKADGLLLLMHMDGDKETPFNDTEPPVQFRDLFFSGSQKTLRVELQEFKSKNWGETVKEEERKSAMRAFAGVPLIMDPVTPQGEVSFVKKQKDLTTSRTTEKDRNLRDPFWRRHLNGFVQNPWYKEWPPLPKMTRTKKEKNKVSYVYRDCMEAYWSEAVFFMNNNSPGDGVYNQATLVAHLAPIFTEYVEGKIRSLKVGDADAQRVFAMIITEIKDGSYPNRRAQEIGAAVAKHLAENLLSS